MTELTSIRCIGCEGGIPPLEMNEIKTLLTEVSGWKLVDHTMIQKRFEFKGFYQTMAFVNAVAWIAHTENHHPNIEIGFNYCVVKYITHAVNGLTKNDFICAAKVNQLASMI